MAKKIRNKLRSARRTGTPVGEEPGQSVFEIGNEVPSNGKDTINENSEELEEGVYEVEAVVDHRLRKGGTEYKVRWKGWSQEHDEWLPHSRMDCPEAVEEYWKRKENKAARVREKQRRLDRAQRRSVSISSNRLQSEEKVVLYEDAKDKEKNTLSLPRNDGIENNPSCSGSCELLTVTSSPQYEPSRSSSCSSSKFMTTPLSTKQLDDVKNEEYLSESSGLITVDPVTTIVNSADETQKKGDVTKEMVSVNSEQPPYSSHSQNPSPKFPKFSIPKPPAIPQRKLVSWKLKPPEETSSEPKNTEVDKTQKPIKMKISLKEKSLSLSCSERSSANTIASTSNASIQSMKKDCKKADDVLVSSELMEKLNSEQINEREKSSDTIQVAINSVEDEVIRSTSEEVTKGYEMDIRTTENELAEESCMGESTNNSVQEPVTGTAGFSNSIAQQSSSIQSNQRRIKPIRDHGFARGLSVERIHGFIQKSNILFAIVQFKNCDVVEVISVKVIQHYEPKALIRGFEEHCVRSDFAKSGMKLLDHQDNSL